MLGVYRVLCSLKFLQVDNWEVTKFLSAVWRSLSSAENARNWKELSENDKNYFTSLACSMIDADWSLNFMQPGECDLSLHQRQGEICSILGAGLRMCIGCPLGYVLGNVISTPAVLSCALFLVLWRNVFTSRTCTCQCNLRGLLLNTNISAVHALL